MDKAPWKKPSRAPFWVTESGALAFGVRVEQTETWEPWRGKYRGGHTKNSSSYEQLPRAGLQKLGLQKLGLR